MKPLIYLLSSFMLLSCVSQKKYTTAIQERDSMMLSRETLQVRVEQRENTIVNLQNDLSLSEEEIKELQRQQRLTEATLQAEQSKALAYRNELDYLRNTNTNLLQRLEDLSVVSKTGAESIRQSLEALEGQNAYIRDLTQSMQRKDSLNLALVLNLKRSLADLDDEDITIEVKKGVVYVSLSDKMLFQSGRTLLNERAHEVLGKIARVVNDHDNLDILVEGHTDTVAIGKNLPCISDNWDLSVMRATAVVRVLQEEHGVNPARMTAGGRSMYIPKAENSTAAGRSINRRTEIIILPRLEEFFKLLEPPLPN